MKYIYVFISLLILYSCDTTNAGKVDVSHVKVAFDVHRFDRDFFNANATTIGKVKQEYPYLFPGNEPDSIWLQRKNDSLTQALFQKVQAVFGDFKEEKEQLTSLFKHIKYNYPNFKAPDVITLISNLDMDNQVIYADSLLLISLDTYLGEKSVFYANYPEYLKKNYTKQRIPIHVAHAVAKQIMPKVPYRVFMERMIAEGKLKYAVTQFLPNIDEQHLFNYSDAKMQWAIDNEEDIWTYFIEKEYLYSTDKELKERFLEPAPFSKFYIADDNKSPGQIGQWIGYKIVQSYMKNYDVSLPELMATTPEEIFNKSKYKPHK